MAVFGVAEIPLRLPSVLFASASVLLTFGIGAVLFSPSVGLVGAVFHTFNGILAELAAGRRASDHVDTLLICLVEAGILATLVIEKRRPQLAGVVLGVACGLAYLTKSLPGLLLLPIWFLIRWQLGPRSTQLRTLAVAMLVTFAVAAPWTLYAMTTFPREWQYESVYSWRHVMEALETHGGPPWRYLTDMPRYFGELVYLPLVVAAASWLRGTANPARRAMLVWVAVPYVLFSAMATKMPAYVMLAAPALFLIQAEFWLTLTRRFAVENRFWRKALLSMAIVLFALLPARDFLNPTGPLEERARDSQWATDLRDLNRTIGEKKAVIFNLPTPIEAMFYTPYVAYNYMPSGEQTKMLRSRGYEVYVYQPRTIDRGPELRREH